MKLKKLLKVIRPTQAIKIVSTSGAATSRSSVLRLDDKYFKPLVQSLKEYQVQSIRGLSDPSQLPDYQDIIEIKIQGGNNHD